jgi:hypothetical protein
MSAVAAADQFKETLSATHTNGLKIFGFLTLVEGCRCLLPSPPGHR